MSSLVDYRGRSVDVSMFQGVGPGDNEMIQSLIDVRNDPVGSGGGSVVTGVAKLSQRFVLEFLTESGSTPGDRNRGTFFMSMLRKGYMRTAIDVQHEFGMAMIKVSQSLADDELRETPDDESFESASLLSVNLSPGSLSIRVKVNSLAGSSRELIMPIFTKTA